MSGKYQWKTENKWNNDGKYSEKEISYDYNGNKLQKVTDYVSQDIGYFINCENNVTCVNPPEYQYDQNGNLTLDRNKNMEIVNLMVNYEV
jgi:phage terminase large subunit